MPKAKGSKPKGRIASGIHEVSPKRTRGKVYKPLGYGEGFGGAGAKSQQNPRLDMPRATPDIDRQRQRPGFYSPSLAPQGIRGQLREAGKIKLGPTGPMPLDRPVPNPGMSRRIADRIQDKLRRRHDEDIIRPEMIPDWGRRRNLPNPGPDSPLAPSIGQKAEPRLNKAEISELKRERLERHRNWHSQRNKRLGRSN